jgi:hypothetical protein
LRAWLRRFADPRGFGYFYHLGLFGLLGHFFLFSDFSLFGCLFLFGYFSLFGYFGLFSYLSLFGHFNRFHFFFHDVNVLEDFDVLHDFGVLHGFHHVGELVLSLRFLDDKGRVTLFATDLLAGLLVRQMIFGATLSANGVDRHEARLPAGDTTNSNCIPQRRGWG